MQPFHGVKIRIRTDKKQFEFKDDGGEDIIIGKPISNSGLDNEGECQKVSWIMMLDQQVFEV